MSDIARWKQLADDADRSIAFRPRTSFGFARDLARELRAAAERAEQAEGWASVGKTGLCVHSKMVDGCAGCQRRCLTARVAALEEAIASALTSLGTGPAKDGYAYSALDAALAVLPPAEEETE